MSQGMHQQASSQQHHTILSQSTHFVNGPFPATLQVCKSEIREYDSISTKYVIWLLNSKIKNSSYFLYDKI